MSFHQEFNQMAVFWVPVDTLDNARKIARTLVEERLAACANCLPITSFYEWEGKFTEEAEVVMVIKTKKMLEVELEQRLRQLHPYTTPCILRLKPEGVNEDYLHWLIGQVK